MRSACGCNDHPDPILFGQVFRLLCSYSLATPPRGSNVTGGELLSSLMQTKESLAASNSNKQIWLQKIDSIVENDIAIVHRSSNYEKSDTGYLPFEHWVDDSTSDSDDSIKTSDKCFTEPKSINSLNNNNNNFYLNSSDNNSDNADNHNKGDDIINDTNTARYINDKNDDADDIDDEDDNNNNNSSNNYNYNYNESVDDDVILDHDYDITQTSNYVIAYIAGFMARKVSRFTKCSDCTKMLTSTNPTDRDRMIEEMSDGNLIFPSETLFMLIRQLENHVLTVVGTKNFTSNTMFPILQKISTINDLPVLGCDEHRKQFMIKIINNFIVMRGHFLTDFFNRNINNRQIMTKRMRKYAKK